MFEIRCIVGDKKLSEALRALGGLTLEPPVVLPVNAVRANGARVPERNTEKNSMQIASEYIQKNKLKTITASQLRHCLVAEGYSPNGYSYALQQLLKNGIVRKTKKASTYEVV